MKMIWELLLWEPDPVLEFVHVFCGQDVDLEYASLSLRSAFDRFSSVLSLQRGDQTPASFGQLLLFTFSFHLLMSSSLILPSFFGFTAPQWRALPCR